MTRRVTFIHTADLHLGAPFKGIRALSDKWAKRLHTALAEAYSRVVQAALDNAVDFVIIAGDVFDQAKPSYGDHLVFFDGLNRLAEAGIPVYLCTGNHDPYTSWERNFAQLPSSVHMFGTAAPSYYVYKRDNQPLCLLTGRSYYNQTWSVDEQITAGLSRADALAAAAHTTRLDPTRETLHDATMPVGTYASNTTHIPQENCAHMHTGVSPDITEDMITQAPFTVAVCHSGLDLDPLKAPANPTTLVARDVDYWALGHIHMRYYYPSEANPRVVFPGCAQGRAMHETGPRGCCLVTLEEGAPPSIQNIPTASVVWQRLTVDVSECSTLTDIEHAIQRHLFLENGRAHCEEMIVRITLEGATPLHTLLQRPTTLQDMRANVNDSYPVFFCDALIDNTHAPRDKEALLAEGLFPSLVIRVAQRQQRKDADALAFLQDEFIKRGQSLPASVQKRLNTYYEQAENLVLDLLEQDNDT